MTLPTPHKAIWSVIPVFLMVGLFFRHCTLDIQFGDTYFVISAIFLSILFSIFLSIIGFVYWQNRHKKLISWMTFIHIGSTVGMFAFFQIYASFCFSRIFMQLAYLVIGWGLLLIFLTLLFQIFFLINVRRIKV